jgi:magnesium-transporting ATPase (P-type)
MPENVGERREVLRILEKVNYSSGLLDMIASDKETGIIGDVKDLQRRRKFFGKNEAAMPGIRSFFSILWDQLDEFYVQLLLIVATILLILALWSETPYAWVESVSVYFAVLFACLIQTVCDYGKETQFLRLQGEI